VIAALGGKEVSVSLFDLRAALLAKHAQHVVLIHFPIALFMANLRKGRFR